MTRIVNTTIINSNSAGSPIREMRSDPLGNMVWIGYYDGDSAHVSYRDLRACDYSWIVAVWYRLVEDGIRLGVTNGN